MKKVLSLVLALSMVLGMFSFAFAGLSDVEGTKFAGAVEALVELGVVNGYTDGTFKPTKVVTRAEMAKMLVIALGQETAAELAKGTTQFSDVPVDHWATGYINVAAQGGVIKGYPDGRFAPEATVTYAEGVTMATRALGYGRVVEVAGTWPTNYMTKAVELELTDDIEDITGEAGAQRGNVAILLWNMLTTPMWEIYSENQTDGVTYRKGSIMLNVKFPNYIYIKDAIVVETEVDSGKVLVTLDLDRETETTEIDIIGRAIELAKGNFFKLLGQEVTALYNKKSDKFLSLVPTGTSKLVEGFASELEEDDYTINKDAITLEYGEAHNPYIYGVIEKRKAIEAATIVGADNTILVEKIREVTDGYKFNNNMTVNEDALVIFGEEYIAVEDIEEGDILTELVKNELYAISRERVEGTFESLSYEETKDTDRVYLEVDGKEYTSYNALLEAYDGEDSDEEVDIGILVEKDNKYLEEDVEVIFDFLGQPIRLNFGEVTGVSSKSNFYVVTSEGTWNVSDSTGTTKYVKLVGADGEEESYECKETLSEEYEGEIVYATINKKGVVTKIELLEDMNSEDYDYADVEEELDSDNYLGDYKVASSTVVFTIVAVEDEDDNTIIDHYEVTVSEGPSAVKGIEDGGIVVYDVENDIRAKYVFVYKEAKSTDKEVGIVEVIGSRKGITTVTIDGTRYDLEENSVDFDIGDLVAYTVDEDEAKIVFAYSPEEIENAGVVSKVDAELVTIDGEVYDVDLMSEELEDYRIFLVTVSFDDDDNPLFDEGSVEETNWEDVRFKKEDRIAITKPDAKVDGIVIIRGF